MLSFARFSTNLKNFRIYESVIDFASKLSRTHYLRYCPKSSDYAPCCFNQEKNLFDYLTIAWFSLIFTGLIFNFSSTEISRSIFSYLYFNDFNYWSRVKIRKATANRKPDLDLFKIYINIVPQAKTSAFKKTQKYGYTYFCEWWIWN